MKYLKYLVIAAIFFSTGQVGFSQSKECESKLMSLMKDYQKTIESDKEITRQKAEALLEEVMAKAYKKHPECFPDRYQEIHDEIVEEDKKEDEITEKEEQKLVEIEKAKAPPAKPATAKEANSNLASAKNPGIVQSAKYQEYKKGCMVILKDQMVAMKKDLDIKKSKARTGVQRKQVMEGYTRLRMEVIHACVMEKMEEEK